MKTFRVLLHRDYAVEIEARNKKDARELTKYFLSDPQDASTAKEREERRFRFQEVELMINEATEAEEVNEAVVS